jgi:hypothetical protein
MTLSVLSLKVPRESENTPEQTAQLLASLAKATTKVGFLRKMSGQTGLSLSFEVTLVNGEVTFNIVHPTHLSTFIQSQLQATYPDVVMNHVEDYLRTWPTLQPPVSLIFLAGLIQLVAYW